MIETSGEGGSAWLTPPLGGINSSLKEREMVFMYFCLHISMQVYCIRTHAHMHVCLYLCMYLCVCVFVCITCCHYSSSLIGVYNDIHTYIHTYVGLHRHST